jgi:hypothetical protein
VKRAILLVLVGAVIGGGAVWMKTRTGMAAREPDEKSAAGKTAETTSEADITRDADGNVVVRMSVDVQHDVGIVITNPVTAQWIPELRAFGRVLDPAPLGNLLMQLAGAELAFDASHQEFERMKVLKAQTNTSARAFQTAEASYLKDQMAAAAIRLQIQGAWGKKLADLLGPAVVPVGTARQPNPLLFKLADSEIALVRLELPAGEYLNEPPGGARLLRIGGKAAPIEAGFFDFAPGNEPQTQGEGIFFLVNDPKLRLLPGEAVTGYVKSGGPPLAGIIVPRDAVVRTRGKGWVYVRNEKDESFTRKEIPLNHPADTGWFVPNTASPGNRVVVTGAQVLLSEELKAIISAD